MYDDEHNDGGWYSRQETDGERKGLYVFDGGNCDDCSLADRCPNYKNFD